MLFFVGFSGDHTTTNYAGLLMTRTCWHVEVAYYVAHFARYTMVFMAASTCRVTRAYVREARYVEEQQRCIY